MRHLYYNIYSWGNCERYLQNHRFISTGRQFDTRSQDLRNDVDGIKINNPYNTNRLDDVLRMWDVFWTSRRHPADIYLCVEGNSIEYRDSLNCCLFSADDSWHQIPAVVLSHALLGDKKKSSHAARRRGRRGRIPRCDSPFADPPLDG